MKKTRFQLLLFFLMVVQVLTAQVNTSRQLKGRVVADSVSVDRINVNNISSKLATFTQSDGTFEIEVKTGDVLVFSAVNLETVRKTITADESIATELKIRMRSKSVILKEVIIEESSITAESLGIIPYGQKKYTPAERKLYTATSGGGIDGLLNTISGRKAMLKKEILVEKKESNLYRLEALFDETYFTETLKVHHDYVKGFLYYCVEDAALAAALKAKNKTLVMFLIVPIAERFNQLSRGEN
ncbi:MAG: carboxypeptidase-like regulatory domain-containing protein [Flavobacterium sp.]